MGLINFTQINDGDEASDTLFNTRFGQIVDEVNGNLDQDNIKDGSITTAKIVNTSITPLKMNLTKSVDANGWTVYDYGSWKEYHKRVTFTFNLGAGGVQAIALSSHLLPTGMSTIGSNHLTASAYLNGNAYSMGWNFEMVAASTTVNITVINNAGGAINNSGFFELHIKDA